MQRGMVFFIALVCILAFCSTAGSKDYDIKVPVFVSILPQAYFLDRIGGQYVEVEVLVGEGQSPATYEPTPKQMAKLSSAKAYFAIGVPFEKNIMRKIQQSHKKLVVVETQKGITYRYLDDHRHDRDEKGGGESHNRMPDPHIWLDPKLVKVQVRNIHDALCRLDPANAKGYSSNLQAFVSDIDRVDERITAALAPVKGRNMYVFHPAFGYFADSYGLNQVPIEIEGKEPGAKQLAEIIDRAKKEGVRVIFVQPQFSTKSAETVAKAIGGAVIPINPLARDYIANLDRIASAVEKGLH